MGAAFTVFSTNDTPFYGGSKVALIQYDCHSAEMVLQQLDQFKIFSSLRPKIAAWLQRAAAGQQVTIVKGSVHVAIVCRDTTPPLRLSV